jgi:hypothetical protein
MSIVDWLRNWIESLRCRHVWDARFRWEGEWAIFYEECVLCGKVEG